MCMQNKFFSAWKIQDTCMKFKCGTKLNWNQMTKVLDFTAKKTFQKVQLCVIIGEVASPKLKQYRQCNSMKAASSLWKCKQRGKHFFSHIQKIVSHLANTSIIPKFTPFCITLYCAQEMVNVIFCSKPRKIFWKALNWHSIIERITGIYLLVYQIARNVWESM